MKPIHPKLLLQWVVAAFVLFNIVLLYMVIQPAKAPPSSPPPETPRFQKAIVATNILPNTNATTNEQPQKK